jgi:hypothetical protein
MKLKTFLLLLIFYSWFGKDGKAQSSQPVSTPQPTCILTAQFTAIGVSRVLDNRAVGCLNFTLTVDVPITVSALSLQVQVSQGDGSLNCATCTWAVLAPATGANPNTLITGWNATFTTALPIYYNWFQIALTAETGTISAQDPISAKLYGTINGGGSGGGSGGSGCAGTSAAPCVVDGPDAVGANATKPPVQVAGNNGPGGFLRVLDVNAFGALFAASSASLGLADSVSNTVFTPGLVDNSAGTLEAATYPVRPFLFNGATWDRQYSCPNQFTLASSTSGDQQIIALSGAAKIRICSINFSVGIGGVPDLIKIDQGTGVNCAGATATLQTISGIAFDFELGPTQAIIGTGGDAICINPATAQAFSVNGTYAIF